MTVLGRATQALPAQPSCIPVEPGIVQLFGQVLAVDDQMRELDRIRAGPVGLTRGMVFRQFAQNGLDRGLLLVVAAFAWSRHAYPQYRDPYVTRGPYGEGFTLAYCRFVT